MNEPWKYYAKWNKPVIKYHMVYDSIYMKCPEWGNPLTESRLAVTRDLGWWGGERTTSADTVFLFEVLKTFWNQIAVVVTQPCQYAEITELDILEVWFLWYVNYSSIMLLQKKKTKPTLRNHLHLRTGCTKWRWGQASRSPREHLTQYSTRRPRADGAACGPALWSGCMSNRNSHAWDKTTHLLAHGNPHPQSFLHSRKHVQIRITVYVYSNLPALKIISYFIIKIQLLEKHLSPDCQGWWYGKQCTCLLD